MGPKSAARHGGCISRRLIHVLMVAFAAASTMDWLFEMIPPLG
jgi:hypothetical protein